MFRIDAGDRRRPRPPRRLHLARSPPAWETSALRKFLVELHVQLYLPDPWGLILTGILGLMMMAAVVSGLLMHRHLIRDLFLAERPGGRLASVRDRHVLASSWSLPFAFLLAFTGSFFSFAGTIGFPLVASVAFGGDEEAMSATLFEPPVPEDPTPAPLASLDYILADFDGARRRAGHLRRHLRLRPRRRPRLRLARPGRGRHALRAPTSTKARAAPSSAARRRSAPRRRPAAASTA